ncbi:hypothetical protein AVEN_148781-1 [Araneus ventricosus]|uniref:Uncharacterized protein n=1 Tax=Araneus ventricosus TaxID=182803 RepID=A0A4Y2TQ47_ARAVE|nr:hypothetical protein AVEN_148781-1 [Araneus ventricosus]
MWSTQSRIRHDSQYHREGGKDTLVLVRCSQHSQEFDMIVNTTEEGVRPLVLVRYGQHNQNSTHDSQYTTEKVRPLVLVRSCNTIRIRHDSQYREELETSGARSM